MARDQQITITISGLPEDDGRVRLNVLMGQLQNLSAAITRLDRAASGGEPSNYLQIVSLSSASPATIVLEPKEMPKRPHTATRVIQRFAEALETITRGEAAGNVDAELLENMRGLAQPIGKRVAGLTLAVGPSRFEFTEAVARQIELALAVSETCDGSVDGRLEWINIHGGANTFHIYPLFGPTKITCHFPARLLDDAIGAINRRVEVTGTLKYRTRAHFPHEIAVESLEAFPRDNELPTFDDLRGRAPAATGTLSSEDFIREIRDEWQ